MGFTDETQIVEPIPEAMDIKTMLRPARSLGCKDAEHWKELDGAMDAAISGSVTPTFEFSALSSFVTFLGYGVLQQLSQDALIRLCIQTRTDEMLRAWIEIKCDDEEKKEALERAIKEKNVRERLSQALTLMGLMGGSYLFIDTGWEDENLKDPLNK